MFKKFFTKNSNLSTEDQKLIQMYADDPELAEELAERQQLIYVRQSVERKFRHKRNVMIACFSALLVCSILVSFFIGKSSHVTSITVPNNGTYNIKDVKQIGATLSGDTIVLTNSGTIYKFSK